MIKEAQRRSDLRDLINIDLIEAWRKNSGFSHDQAGFIIGISRESWMRMIGGECHIKLYTLKKLAGLMKIELRDLIALSPKDDGSV